MIVAMIDANHISERLASLKLEMSDLGVANARYWSRKEHTALDKSASALRQQRLIQIKLELADMMKRCAYPPRRAAVNSGKNEKPPDGDDGRPGADEQSGRTRLSRLELYPIMG